MRVGIDALNLRADERGMGRYVRRIVRDLAARPEWAITLLVRDGNHYRDIKIDYHGGLRYPHLERMAGTPDRLADILAPLK